MKVQDLDLAQPPFWMLVVVATVALAFARRPAAKSPLFSLLNVTLLGYLVGWWAASFIGVGVIASWWLAGRLHRTTRPMPWLIGAGLLTTGIFFVQKLPGTATALHVSGLAPILSAIGFSYAALRMVELWRAMVDKRHRPPSIVETVNYLLPFHMLAAGPIQSIDDFVAQPGMDRPLTSRDAMEGIWRIALGCFKKFVLASSLNAALLGDLAEPGVKWLVQAPVFFLWLYLDFSAYSDIACGAGRLMRVHTPENFNKPYLARNMIDFWDRWHISLSLWIRRNLFYPTQLSLMRWTGGTRPLLCASIAFFVAFSLCGVWHQVTTAWFLWGVINAVGLIVVNVYRAKLQRRLGSTGMKRYLASRWIKWVAMALTLALVSVAQVPIIAAM